MQMSASWNTQHVYLGFGAWTAFTYLGLALDLGIGQRLARNTEHPGWLSLAAVLGSLQFFVVSNFGVWATGSECVLCIFKSQLAAAPSRILCLTRRPPSFSMFALSFRVRAFTVCSCLLPEASMRTTWPV